MKIQTFNNMKGLIHGSDPKRIECEREGILRIGNTEIHVLAGTESIMPTLFHGATGNYDATFTDYLGNVYDLAKVSVRGGRITPPPATAVEFMDLRCRAEQAEKERDAMLERIIKLENIFDTNSLNFLIK